MPLTIAQRKQRLRDLFGAQRDIAADQGVSKSYVSQAVSEELRPKTPRAQEKLRQVQAAIADKLGEKVEDVFPQMQQEAAPAARAS